MEAGKGLMTQKFSRRRKIRQSLMCDEAHTRDLRQHRTTNTPSRIARLSRHLRDPGLFMPLSGFLWGQVVRSGHFSCRHL